MTNHGTLTKLFDVGRASFLPNSAAFNQTERTGKVFLDWLTSKSDLPRHPIFLCFIFLFIRFTEALKTADPIPSVLQSSRNVKKSDQSLCWAFNKGEKSWSPHSTGL